MTKAAIGPTPAIEWPTLALAPLIYGAFGLLTWNHEVIPWWLVVPLAGYLLTWHGSLQHEVVHGHPTRWPLLNEALVFPSLWLWLPFRLYRQQHLTHHRDEDLTDPQRDPESYYVTRQTWGRLGPLTRGLLTFHNSVAGRLLLGPLYSWARLYLEEAARLAKGDTRHLGIWLLHGLAVAPVLIWVIAVCGIGFFEYLLLFVYPGISLTLLRSFLEHRARDKVAERVAVVEAGPLLSLLYLNNNLHAVHHAEPSMAWYRLPAYYRAHRRDILADNEGYLYQGYHQVIGRYLLRPKEPVLHPLESATPAPVLTAAQ